MGRDGGFGASADADERLGCVEKLHHGDELAAFDGEVDAAAFVVRIQSARAEHAVIEQTGDREDGIAHDFGFETLRNAPTEIFVEGIELFRSRIGLRVLQVGGAGHDEPVHLFDAPPAPDEFAGEPIEEFRIAGALALSTEIVWCRDDAATEMVLPNTVHYDTSGELAGAVIDISDPIRERTAAIRRGATAGRIGLPFLFLFR